MDTDDLHDRLAHAAHEITVMRDIADNRLGGVRSEYWRLEGKRQGIELAIDYLRGERSDGPL